MANKPCDTCKRVRDPKDCENKQCKVWQQWFLDRWKEVNNYYRQACESNADNAVLPCCHGSDCVEGRE